MERAEAVRPSIPCPVLVGRATELQLLTDALDTALAGRGGAVFVTGEAGIGKSRLVHEVAAVASERGARIVRGRAVPGAGAAPFRPLTEALAALVPAGGAVNADLEPWLPALAAVVPPLAPRGGGVAETPAPALGEAVLRFLHSACTLAGGLLVLEDLHWADPDTLAIVEHLTDNLERAPVLCVATVRPEEDTPARELVLRVASRRTAPVLELHRLNAAQVAAMVHSCTGGIRADAVDRVAELSDGVPFLVEEMLASPGLPASFSDGVERRFGDLPERDRQVLATAAAFGRHFDWRLLPAATELGEADVIDALERAVGAQFLTVDGDGFRFRHALTAEAVFHAVVPPRRQAYAAAALAALDAAYGEPSGDLRDVAALLAERAGARERAGHLCYASGEEALRRGALQSAALALGRAVRLLRPSDANDRARERLIDALAQLGRVDDAREAAHDLVHRFPPPRAAALHLRVAAAATTAARWDVATGELDAARRLIGAEGGPALHAELAIREAEVAIETNRAAVAEERAESALRTARDADLPALACAALQLLGRCRRRSSLEGAESCFAEALAIAEAHDLALWRLRALHEIGTIALLGRGEVGVLEEAQAMAESVGAVVTAAVLDLELAAGFDGTHDLEREAWHGHRAVRRGRQLGLDLVVAYGWLHVAGAAVLSGDPDEAERAAAAGRAAAPGNDDVDGLLVGACDVVGALLADDIERALGAAERAAALLRGSETAPPAHYRALWPLLLAVAGRPEASAAVEELERAGVSVASAARALLAMARAVVAGRSDRDRARPLAVQADEELGPFPLWRCLARRLAAAAAAAAGWHVPGEWLAEAEQWLRAHGYQTLADACAALQPDTPRRVPPSWARHGITPREADVLELVIEGCSNREIAETLYLSVRTVEKHVESLLRKTASRSRTQLARAAAIT